VAGVEECRFYHTMDIPGHGTVQGEWDLRGRVDEYLGGVPLAGRRVLEVGTASGFLCFEMERRGAEVVALDLSAEQPLDFVPFAGDDQGAFRTEMSDHVDRLNNAWWLGHRAFGSRARVVYASAYEVPEAIGPVDVCTFGCVLLHLRDPFAALASALRLTRETAVVTEFLGPRLRPGPRLLRERNPFLVAQALALLRLQTAVFLPDHRALQPKTGWWLMTPALVRRFLGALGFGETRVHHHTHSYGGIPHRLYTVVGRRTRGGVG
jgi:SAM-dependent methyltransferase